MSISRGKITGASIATMAAKHGWRVGRLRKRNNTMETERNEETCSESHSNPSQAIQLFELREAIKRAIRSGISPWRCREIIKEVLAHDLQHDRNI